MRRDLLIATVLLSILATATAAQAARPTTAQTIAAADRLGVGSQARALQKRFLPAARLIASGGRARLGATRIGGGPDLSPTARWPRCNGHALTFVAQVDLASLRAAVPGVTRGTGLLSLFMGTRYAPDTAPEAAGIFAVHGVPSLRSVKCIAVLHTAAGAKLRHRTPAAGSNPFPSTPQRLRPTLTVPDYLLARDHFGITFPENDGWGSLQDRAASGVLGGGGARAPFAQLLGWSIPLQEDPTLSRCHGQASRLLLQFDSDEDFYDLDQSEDGFLMVTIGASDLRDGRFDHLCGEHQFD